MIQSIHLPINFSRYPLLTGTRSTLCLLMYAISQHTKVLLTVFSPVMGFVWSSSLVLRLSRSTFETLVCHMRPPFVGSSSWVSSHPFFFRSHVLSFATYAIRNPLALCLVSLWTLVMIAVSSWPSLSRYSWMLSHRKEHSDGMVRRKSKIHPLFVTSWSSSMTVLRIWSIFSIIAGWCMIGWVLVLFLMWVLS